MRTVIGCMVTLIALNATLCGCAHAAAAKATPPDDQVALVGETHDTPKVTTSGTDIALRTALRMLVPTDYSINLPNAGAWAATPVSWTSGHSLVATLRDMLRSHPELAAQVDTDFQLITVRYRQPFGTDTLGTLPAANPMPVQTQTIGQTPLVGGTTPGTPGVKPPLPAAATGATSGAVPVKPMAPAGTGPTHVLPLPVSSAAPATGAATGSARTIAETAQSENANAASAAAPSRVWRIELSDRTVRAALTRWAREAGWQLIWEAPVDYTVDAPASVNGTFEDALQSVVGALASSNQPIQAILYRGNNVLRIVEKGAG